MSLPEITWDAQGRPWRVVNETKTTYWKKMPDDKGKLVLKEISYMVGTLEPMPKNWSWEYEEELQRQKALRNNGKE